MSYSWSCDNCRREESFGNYTCDVREGLHRMCDRCGRDGCVDCIPNEVCSTCAHDPDYAGLDYKCDPPCPACLNSWSHG